MNTNIRKIYSYRILLSMLFPVPTIVLFWQRHGMSLTDVMVLQSLFSIAMVVFEIPSGYLADIIGRKKTLIYAAIACLIAVVIYSQGGNNLYHTIAGNYCREGCNLRMATLEDVFLKLTGRDLRE